MTMGPDMVLDILNSDVKIVDSTTRSAEVPGKHLLRFPGLYMPDGKDFLGEVPEKLDPSVLKEWCNAVRREYDARNNRKEAEAASRRQSSAAGPADASGGSANPARSDSDGAADAGKAGEADMEGYLKAEVARWTELKRKATEAVAAADRAAQIARARLDSASRHVIVAEEVLRFYLETANAPENSG